MHKNMYIIAKHISCVNVSKLVPNLNVPLKSTHQQEFIWHILYVICLSRNIDITKNIHRELWVAMSRSVVLTKPGKIRKCDDFYRLHNVCMAITSNLTLLLNIYKTLALQQKCNDMVKWVRVSKTKWHQNGNSLKPRVYLLNGSSHIDRNSKTWVVWLNDLWRFW